MKFRKSKDAPALPADEEPAALAAPGTDEEAARALGAPEDPDALAAPHEDTADALADAGAAPDALAAPAPEESGDKAAALADGDAEAGADVLGAMDAAALAAPAPDAEAAAAPDAEAAAAPDADAAPAPPSPPPEDAPARAQPPREPRGLARALVLAGVAVGAVAAVLALIPDFGAFATPGLALAFGLLAGGAWTVGRDPGVDARERGADFRRDLVVNVSVLLLNLAFLLLALVQVLSVPAALGHLRFFGTIAVGFVAWYPLVLLGLLVLTAVALLHHARAPLPHFKRKAGKPLALGGLGVAGVVAVAALLVQLGLTGLAPQRAVFVLSVSAVALYVFIVQWTRMPSFEDIVHWMETEERLQDTQVLRNVGYAALALTGVSLVFAILARAGIFSAGAGLVGLGAAMLCLVPAALTVGVKRFIAQIHAHSAAEAGETRARARVILSAFSVGLTAAASVLGVITFLAFLAQVAGIALFDNLLAFFVTEYPVILSLALVPVMGVVFARTRVASEEEYTDARKAVTVIGSVLTILLGALGIFLGSGIAQGAGFEIENGVLVMAAGVLALLAFVQARLMLPSVWKLAKSAVTASEDADTSLKEDIQRRMMATYVTGLVFVLSFVGYVASTALGVLPAPGDGLATDSLFFLYLMGGLILLFVVGIRFLQGVNIDPRWKKKDTEAKVGKKRLSASDLQKYIVLGFSTIAASTLFTMGVLVQIGVITELGPLPIAQKFSTDFFVFAILLGLGPYGFYHNREINRRREIDTRFPDFLRDIAESQRAGMTLTEAVVTAAKGSYGVLTPEVRKMAAQIEWGVSFTDALRRFSKRVNTPLIERTVSLIVQASRAGGNVVDVLTAAADDAREIHMILKERKQSMSIYVMIIYIAFFVFIGVIGVLNAQFIPEVSKAVSAAAESGSVSIGGLTLTPFDEQEFRTIFFHGAVIQGFGGGLVAGVMEGGKPQTGLKHAFVMVSIAYVVFRFLIGG